MITIRGLTKAYRRRPVLRGLDLEARPGEVTLLVGPNGAGKSTTLRILAGLARADAGEARVAGREVGRERLAAQAQLAFLPQTADFHPRFTCAEILEFYAQVRGCGPAAVAGAIERAGLAGAARERTGQLSGGLRQRLGLAVLLLPDAPVLLLDEPDLSLDPEWRRRLQELLHQEAHRGKTVLVTTHLLAEWNDVAHRCLLCQEGVIARELDPANLADTFDEAVGAAGSPGPASPGGRDAGGPASPLAAAGAEMRPLLGGARPPGALRGRSHARVSQTRPEAAFHPARAVDGAEPIRQAHGPDSPTSARDPEPVEGPVEGAVAPPAAGTRPAWPVVAATRKVVAS